jgi:hypothetical protein
MAHPSAWSFFMPEMGSERRLKKRTPLSKTAFTACTKPSGPRSTDNRRFAGDNGQRVAVLFSLK